MTTPDDQTTKRATQPQHSSVDPVGDCPSTPGAAPAALPASVLQIPVAVQVVLGTVRLPIGKVADLRAGSVLTLDQKLGTPVAILVNGSEVAKGDLFVLDGDGARLGVTITDLAPSAETS